MTRRALIVHASADRYGSDRCVLHIASGARSAGWDVEVVVPEDGPLVAELAEADVVVHRVETLVLRRADLRRPTVAARLPGRFAVAARELLSLARRRRIDLVQSNTALVLGGAITARRLRLPHVWYVHEVFWGGGPSLRIAERLLRAADVVVCNSRASLDQFSAALGSRLRVVYPGVDVPDAVACSDPFASHPPRLVCVARLNDWKGQDVLVRATALLRDAGHDLRVSLVGGVFRGERHHLERARALVRELGLSDVVTFEGETDDVAAVVGAADVFVLPSKRAEPFGIALVEAMGLGRPVVATAQGGPSEIVTDGVDGLLVAPDDEVALARALARLLEDPPLARRLGERARRRAADFRVERMVAGVLDAYEDASRIRSG